MHVFLSVVGVGIGVTFGVQLRWQVLTLILYRRETVLWQPSDAAATHPHAQYCTRWAIAHDADEHARAARER